MTFGRTYYLLPLLLSLGCASEETTEAPVGDSNSPVGVTVGVTVDDAPEPIPSESAAPMEFKPLSTATNAASVGSPSDAAGQALPPEANIKAVMAKLKPLQVMLGQWRGTTRKEFDGFKAVDGHEWIWDLRSNPSQPSLAISSDKSPYLRKANLTFEPAKNTFALRATDAEDITREFVGDFTDPVHEIVGPDDKLHRVFRLELTQTDASAEESGNESWQLAFTQQENNRYLLEVSKRRGTASFRRYDTVSTQREGTSFAISDSDYGEKTCIISQGLGTTAVSYKGKTYWVCCSGCKAAFEEDPETWIARAEKRAAEKN